MNIVDLIICLIISSIMLMGSTMISSFSNAYSWFFSLMGCIYIHYL